MKAMTLAAGLGTRLRPLTDTRPKALVEINGRTLLEITLTRLRSFGVNEVIINVHHFAELVVEYLKSHHNFGMRIEISREDDLLLDTGGGLKKASWFFLEATGHAVEQGEVRGALRPSPPKPTENKIKGVIPSEARDPGKTFSRSPNDQTPGASNIPDEPFLLHNVDVISDIDFGRMLHFHNEHRALATLAVQSRQSSRLLLFNDQLQLIGRRLNNRDTLISTLQNLVIQNSHSVISSEARNPGKSPAQPSTDQPSPTASSATLPLASRHSALPLAFSGIHIISPRLLPMLTEEGVFSIIDAYLRLAAEGEKILAFRADEYYWRDLGRPSDLSQAALDLRLRSLL